MLAGRLPLTRQARRERQDRADRACRAGPLMRWFSPKSSSLRPVRHGHLRTMQLRPSPAPALVMLMQALPRPGSMGTCVTSVQETCTVPLGRPGSRQERRWADSSRAASGRSAGAEHWYGVLQPVSEGLALACFQSRHARRAYRHMARSPSTLPWRCPAHGMHPHCSRVRFRARPTQSATCPVRHHHLACTG